MTKISIMLILLITTLIINQCTNDQIAGGSSDHGNSKIAGIVTDGDGEPAEGVNIRLLPFDYNPVKDDKQLQMETVSNTDGCFIFDNLDSGTYCISGEDTNSRCFVTRAKINASQLIILSTLELNYAGSISIQGDSIGLKPGNIAYLKGLQKYCTVDSSGKAIIENVPSGVVSLSGYSIERDSTIALNHVFDSLVVLPNLTIVSSISPSPFFMQDGKALVDKRNGFTDSLYMFSCVDPVQNIPNGYSFRYFWGDGVTSEWTENPRQIYKWKKPGVYLIQAQVSHFGNSYYAWSNPISITVLNSQ